MNALVDSALRLLAARGPHASLWVKEVEDLRYEHEPRGGGVVSRTAELFVEARDSLDGARFGVVRARVSSPEELAALLSEARRRAPEGVLLIPGAGAAPSPLGAPRAPTGATSSPTGAPRAQDPVAAAPPSLALGERSPERARALAAALVDALGGATLQAVLVHQTIERWALLGAGVLREDARARESLLARAEAAQGAIVDGLWQPLAQPPSSIDSLAQWMEHALSALAAGGERAPEGLPWVLRPQVSAALLSALGWSLGGDVAAAAPGLMKAFGKQAFPSCLTLVDLAGPSGRRFDDEGTAVADVKLVERGVLARLLHSRASAAALHHEPTGRYFHPSEERGAGPAPLGLTALPSGAALPAGPYLELVARAETFTTQPRPGVVSFIAAGHVVDGSHRRRVRPIECELPLFPTLRRLVGVLDDGRWIPSFENVLAPSLILAAPT